MVGGEVGREGGREAEQKETRFRSVRSELEDWRKGGKGGREEGRK